MGIGELLDQIRQLYVDQLLEIASETSEGQTNVVIFEPALRDEEGNAIGEGELELPVRVDFAVLENNAVSEMLNISSDRMLGFETISFTWGENVRVTLNPFQWHGVPFQIDTPQDTDWQPLTEWYMRWFQPDEDGDFEHLLGAVHFLSDPQRSGEQHCFEADLGSAPVNAFEELLDTFAKLGTTNCWIGGRNE